MIQEHISQDQEVLQTILIGLRHHEEVVCPQEVQLPAALHLLPEVAELYVVQVVADLPEEAVAVVNKDF